MIIYGLQRGCIPHMNTGQPYLCWLIVCYSCKHSRNTLSPYIMPKFHTAYVLVSFALPTTRNNITAKVLDMGHDICIFFVLVVLYSMYISMYFRTQSNL